MKLELPSISQVQSRGFVDAPFNPTHYASANERYSALPQIQPQASSSSDTSSPRGGTFSTSSAVNSNHSSNTSYSSSIHSSNPHTGLKTPSPEHAPPNGFPTQESPYSVNGNSYGYNAPPYGSMNHPQPYMDVQQPHLSTQGHPASSAPPTTSLPHYSHYSQQPAILHSGPGSYPTQGSYHYGYTGVSQPQSAGHPGSASMGSQLMPQPLSLPGKAIFTVRLRVTILTRV